MKIGYLHIGILQSAESGVTRYGRFIAAEAHRRPDLSVIEADVSLTNDRQHNRLMLTTAARQLFGADVVHIQYGKHIWGGGWRQLRDLWSFISHCSCPLVVTLHDIYPSTYPPYSLTTALVREYKLQLQYKAGVIKTLGRTVRTTWRDFLADTLALRWLSSRAQVILVCTEEEAQRLGDRVDSRKLKVLPHFVEERTVTISPLETRAALGLEGAKIVTLQGFIYRDKGHRLMIEAMPKLPQDVKVVFAGGPAPNQESLVHELLKLAEAKGVADRLRVTGYLSDEELERYLVATDLAVCPFKMFSASGSLSTWISLARPVLASDLPQIAEYNRIEPGAINTFNPYTTQALAEAIQQLLPMCQESVDPAVARLREQLSMPKIFDEHLNLYHAATKPIQSNF